MQSEKEVLEIADYLGCNGPELWSEISKLITTAETEAYKKGYLDGSVSGFNVGVAGE